MAGRAGRVNFQQPSYFRYNMTIIFIIDDIIRSLKHHIMQVL